MQIYYLTTIKTRGEAVQKLNERAEQLRDAEREGQKAYCAGQLFNTNPFWPTEDKGYWIAWAEGFLNAKIKGIRHGGP